MGTGTSNRTQPTPVETRLASGGNAKARRYTIGADPGETFQPPGKLTNVIFSAPSSNAANIKLNFGGDGNPQFFILEPGVTLPAMQIRDDKNIQARRFGGTDLILCAIYWG